MSLGTITIKRSNESHEDSIQSQLLFATGAGNDRWMPRDKRNREDSWPQFRGTDSQGIATSTELPDAWSAENNVVWKRDVEGRGWSSPVVWGDHVFLTTVVNTGESEKPKKGLYFGGDRPKAPDAVHHWKVICLDVHTGKVRWEQQVHQGKPDTSIHLKSSYASETPSD